MGSQNHDQDMAQRRRSDPYAVSVAILIFFVAHWQLSVFFQSFFQHRYAAHRMFTMSRGWERTFNLLAYLVQGSSYLTPRGYAILHRMHHAYSDTPKDPHSPHQFKNLFEMMWWTKKRYHAFAYKEEQPEPRFAGGYPEWDLIDRMGSSWAGRFAWGTMYALFYMKFATHWWMFALVPIHWLMGPVHGAIVNWGGHKYGYRNFDDVDDKSRNTIPVDVLTAGELFQNNHHKFGQSPSFAARWFEIDPTYQVMRVLAWLKIIDMSGAQKIRWAKTAKPPEVGTAATEGGRVIGLSKTNM
jgi:stearoyl-CoA desaturase (delta-9 desaturase)